MCKVVAEVLALKERTKRLTCADKLIASAVCRIMAMQCATKQYEHLYKRQVKMQVCRTNRDQVGQVRGEIWKPDAVSVLVDNTCNNFLGVQVFFALIHSANWAISLTSQQDV